MKKQEGRIKGITDGSEQCECHQCIKDLEKTFNGGSWGIMPLSSAKMIVCGTCGNKRCPKANDHRNECTWSNESGQRGSAYESAKPQTGSE